MKHTVTLTVTSVLSILFTAFHLTDDIVRGFEPGGVSTIVGVLLLVIFFWVWTLIALGVTTIFSVILSVHGLWSLRSSQSR